MKSNLILPWPHDLAWQLVMRGIVHSIYLWFHDMIFIVIQANTCRFDGVAVKARLIPFLLLV